MTAIADFDLGNVAQVCELRRKITGLTQLAVAVERAGKPIIYVYLVK